MSANKQERVGVYVCHCGSNIAGTVDVEDVAKWAAEKLGHQGVIVARDYKFMCSSLGQELIEKDIKELGLTRVVVAACSPHFWAVLLRRSFGLRLRQCLVPVLRLFCMRWLRRHCFAWAHTPSPFPSFGAGVASCSRRS